MALQEVILTLGEAQLSETRIALTLMDLGYTSGDDLRAWSAKEAASVLASLLTWKRGEIYFEDNQQPPADRLLVALTITSLLPPTAPSLFSPVQQGEQAEPFQPPATPPVAQQAVVQPPIPIHPPASLSAAQLLMETPQVAPSFGSPQSPRSRPTIDLSGDGDVPTHLSLSQPQPLTMPLRPIQVDTTLVRPEMVLFPVDLSALREQNPQVTLTPEQWRLLTRADGRTTLQEACFELGMPSDVLRQVAGELSALGLVRVMVPSRSSEVVSELSPVSRQLLIFRSG